MQSNKNYDTSFVDTYRWSQPEHAAVALNIVECANNGCTEHERCPTGHSEYVHIQLSLASNPRTPGLVLDFLSSSASDTTVLERIAGNPNTSAQTLRRLAKHQCNDVRAAVAENKNTEIDVLETLCADPHADVRYSLAENPYLPAVIIERLAQDDNPYVAHRAQLTRQRLRTPFSRLSNGSFDRSRIRRVI
jgi:hypothetical protein